MLALALLPREFEALLIFHRQHIMTGELWRVFTGHLIHLSWQHLLMNIFGLWLIIWLAKGCISTTEWFITLLLSSLLISGALLFFSDISWYVGFSGILHSFLILIAYRLVSQSSVEGWFLLIFVLIKIGWEQWQGASTELEHIIGGNVVTDAHLYGVIAGVLIAPLLSRHRFAQHTDE